jgi:hypothetical protein
MFFVTKWEKCMAAPSTILSTTVAKVLGCDMYWAFSEQKRAWHLNVSSIYWTTACENSCFLLSLFGTKWEKWMSSQCIIIYWSTLCENAWVRHLLGIFGTEFEIRMPAPYILSFLYQLQCFEGKIGPPNNEIFRVWSGNKRKYILNEGRHSEAPFRQRN